MPVSGGNYDKQTSDPRLIFLPEPSTIETAVRNFTQAASPSHAW